MYAATLERMKADPSVYLMGEGAQVKVHFDCPEIERLFPERVITMPIAEDAVTNFAVGMSLGGVTPVVDVISSDFLFRTMDAICNTAAKQAYTSGPRTIVIKAEFLTGGPTTGQRIEAMFTGVPGLHVSLPSNPQDAYALTREALERKGVTLLFEDRMVEDATTPEDLRTHRESPGMGTRHRAHGDTATVVSYGIMARRLEGWSMTIGGCDLFDLRMLYPLDLEPIIHSAMKTGCLLVVEPDGEHNGIGAEVIASVIERTDRKICVERLGAPRKVIPVSHELQQAWLPSEAEVATAIVRLIS
jgi:pyruvate/2-oxoglutarate/acetoin dehydrogenase E1 component